MKLFRNFKIVLLTANKNYKKIIKQAKIFNVKNLIITNRERYISFKKIHKRKYRIIDFKRIHDDIEGTVERLEYDPNRTSFIALIKYSDDKLTYIIAPQKLNVGDKIISGDKKILIFVLFIMKYL